MNVKWAGNDRDVKRIQMRLKSLMAGSAWHLVATDCEKAPIKSTCGLPDVL